MKETIKNFAKKKEFYSFIWATVLLVAPVPLIYSIFSAWSRLNELSTFTTEAYLAIRKSEAASVQKQERQNFVSWLTKSDSFYLDKHVTPLLFLRPEIERLSSTSHPFKGRLHFLNQENRLSFKEESVQKKELYKEVELSQLNPVEMNEEDLKQFLVRITGVPIAPYSPIEQRPPLSIKELHLSKKAISPKEEVLLVWVKLKKLEKL